MRTAVTLALGTGLMVLLLRITHKAGLFAPPRQKEPVFAHTGSGIRAEWHWMLTQIPPGNFLKFGILVVVAYGGAFWAVNAARRLFK